MKKAPEQPSWIDDLIGIESYGIEITDAYLASNSNHGSDTVIVLETTSKHHSRGYWYYDSTHEQWYWSIDGTAPEAAQLALDVIKENINPTSLKNKLNWKELDQKSN